MLATEKAQGICLTLAAIGLVVALYAVWMGGQLENERLAWLLSDTRTGPPGMLWPDSVRQWSFGRLEYFAFLYALLAVGAFLILYFMGRPWPYQLFVPAVVVGAVIAHFISISTYMSSALTLFLGPLIGIGFGFGWFMRMGSIGLLITTVPMILSARSVSRKVRVSYLVLFAVLWTLDRTG